ncbi:cell division protein FtsB [Elongatibacter sediminis]|uniref:Cell division protein FtsB n=1 Tax=Elongatibacter sediminis TaxID=3119006 RepID=A0AAW9RHR1_9GAMM
MRLLLAILLVLLALLQFNLWFGEGGFADIRRLEQRVSEQERENALLQQRNRELEAEVDDLRQGLEAIEERARSEMGMIKEGEEFYQVVPGQGAPPEEQK